MTESGGEFRRPAVAGYFYSGDAAGLRSEVEALLPRATRPVEALGAVVPHAGLKYSGRVAGEVLAGLAIPQHVLIFGLNHRPGSAPDFSIWPGGAWHTPLGDVPVDAELTAAVLRAAPGAKADREAHREEHSAEVQLPLLQLLRPDARIAVVSIGSRNRQALTAFGEGVAETVRGFGRPVLTLASTDFTHYETQKHAEAQDALAIEAIRRLDPGGLFDTVRSRNISMCGVGPTTAALACWRKLGAREAVLVRYATSGDASGDYDRVVGYAGFRVFAPSGERNS